MYAVRPLRYTAMPSTDYVTVTGYEFEVKLDVIQLKRLGMFDAGQEARLTLTSLDGQFTVEVRYPLPRDLRVGHELSTVERRIYAAVDELRMGVGQLRAVALDREHLWQQDAGWGQNIADAEEEAELSLSLGLAPGARAESWDQLFIGRLLLAIRQVTKISSLSLTGYAEAVNPQAPTAHSGQKLVRQAQAVRPAPQIRTPAASWSDLAQAAADILLAVHKEGGNLHSARKRLLDYLAGWAAGAAEVPSAQAVDFLIGSYAPAYLALRSEPRKRKLPRSFLLHSLKSVVVGGLGGVLVIDIGLQIVLRDLFRLDVNYPGWSIGVAVTFFWPYVMALIPQGTGNRSLASREAALLRSAQDALSALPAGEREEFLDRIDRQRRRA